MTAQIIPFPPRPAAPPKRGVDQRSGLGSGGELAAGGSDAQARLARALQTLDAAMAEQRSAMAAWRGALADLKASTAGLGRTLDRYRVNVDRLGDGLISLQRQTSTLQNWAGAAEPDPQDETRPE